MNFIRSLGLLLISVIWALPSFAIEQGGMVRAPMNAESIHAEFNPFDGSQDDLIKGVIYEPLLLHNSMTGEVHYRLAESVTYNKNNTSLTIKLRPNLQWSDGQALDADDIVFSFDLARKVPEVDRGGLWSDGTFKTVRKLDNRTVRIDFNTVNATVDWYLPEYYMIPQHVWSQQSNVLEFNNLPIVGSGPFTEVEAEETEVTVCRNNRYWEAGKPYIDCVQFLARFGNDSVMNALVADEIDWGAGFLADIDKNYVAKDPEHYHYWYPSSDLINLYFNTAKKPFNDLRFRQAFSLAMDRETITLLAGFGNPTHEKHVTGIGLYWQAYFNDAVNGKYDWLAEYNPDKAREILDKAGYKDRDGDGYREDPQGKEIKFGIRAVDGWTDWMATVAMVAEYLGDVGIHAYADIVDWAEYDSSLKNSTYEVSMNWTLTGPDPIATYRDYYHTSRIGQAWQANHGINNSRLDSLIDNYAKTTNPQTRKNILTELMTFTGENLPFVSLWSNPTWYQYNTKHIQGWPTADNPYVQPWFFNQTAKLLMLTTVHKRQ